MPACKDCKHFDPEGPICVLASSNGIKTLTHPYQNKKAIKACKTAIILKYKDDIKGEVLEVGHGVQSGIRRYLARPGASGKWYGIDPRWPDNVQAGHYGASVDNIPFDSDRFDWVVGFETMEHWEEGGVELEDGLKEIHRVLKPGGKLLLTVPIHVHGGDIFYFGKFKSIRSLFILPNVYIHLVWESVKFESWRREYEPLQPVYAWEPKWQRGAYRSKAKERAKKLTAEGNKPSSWKLEILATKA